MNDSVNYVAVREGDGLNVLHFDLSLNPTYVPENPLVQNLIGIVVTFIDRRGVPE